MSTALVSTSVRSIVLTALFQLGPTPRIVAHALADLGVKGTWGAKSCPITNYIRGRVLRGRMAYDDYIIITSRAGIVIKDPLGEEIAHWIETPPVIAAFVGQFDRGAHPDLFGEMHGLEPQPTLWDDDDVVTIQ